jgi:hypothetical protein
MYVGMYIHNFDHELNRKLKQQQGTIKLDKWSEHPKMNNDFQKPHIKASSNFLNYFLKLAQTEFISTFGDKSPGTSPTW